MRVACHRGDWRNFVENTLEAVESCIEMGADIVEVDVWQTKDGVLVLMHDETVDRTSSGVGRVADHTISEIRAMRLKDGLGNMTEYTIPTVEEVLLLAKDRTILNLDKADLYLDSVYDLLVKTNMVNQVILKSEMSYEDLCLKWGEDLMTKLIFMPIINITKTTTVEQLQHIFSQGHSLYEINFEDEDSGLLLDVRKMAEQLSAVVWINTIWPSTCGGHSDDHALKNKDSTWGYVVDQLGCGIVQTDRPAQLLKYLQKRGSR